jgi:hypothetical protein
MSRFLTHYSPEGDAGTPGGSPGGQGSPNAPAGGSVTLLQGSPQGQPPAGTPPPQGTPPPAGAPVVQDPFFKDWIGSDGKINPAAYDRLPDRLKPFADTFKKYGSVEDLLNGFGHSTTLNGKKGLMALPKDAPDNVKAEFNARLREILQIPEKPEGYGIAKPADLAPELWDANYVEGVQGIFHKYNVPPEAAKALIEYGAGYGQKAYAEAQAGIAKQLDLGRQELQKAWGSDMPKKLAQAERVARTLGLNPNDESLFRNPSMVQAMAKVHDLISEDKLVQGNLSAAATGTTARQQAKDVVQNTANPLHKAYHDQNHPQHEQALAKVQELNQLAARSNAA